MNILSIIGGGLDPVYTLSLAEYIILLVSAFVIAVSKTGAPGLGILAVPLAAVALPARASTGVVLVMLICADIFAVSYYRKSVVWSHIVKLIPCAVIGIFIGYLLLDMVSDYQLRPIIGAVVLGMLALNFFRKRERIEEGKDIPLRPWFAIFTGLTAGVATMMANAAGPIMAIYLLAMGLPKRAFIGTGAFYFFLVNWMKVPFSANLGLINPESLKINLAVLPAILLGAFAGIMFLKKVPQKVFDILIYLLTSLAALKLIF